MEVFKGKTVDERTKEFNDPPAHLKFDLNKLKVGDSNIPLVESPAVSEKRGKIQQLTISEINQLAEEQALISAIKAEWAEYYKYMKKVQPEAFKELLSPAGVVMMDVKQELKEKHKYGMSFAEIYGYWVVVSPKTDTADFKLLMEFGLKLLNKGNMQGTESWFSIEQRGVTSADMGYGPHINILIKKLETQYFEPRRFEKMIRNHFKRVQEDIDNIRFIWFKAVNEENYNKKIKYVKGIKKDIKMESVKIDKIWRQTYNIKDYYHFT